MCIRDSYQSVIDEPKNNNSHLNIRSFISNGWKGVLINQNALKLK